MYPNAALETTMLANSITVETEYVVMVKCICEFKGFTVLLVRKFAYLLAHPTHQAVPYFFNNQSKYFKKDCEKEDSIMIFRCSVEIVLQPSVRLEK